MGDGVAVLSTAPEASTRVERHFGPTHNGTFFGPDANRQLPDGDQEWGLDVAVNHQRQVQQHAELARGKEFVLVVAGVTC